MIRQAISCDICGRDKQQTNHWFVVYEHGSELRISGWNSQARMSLKAKHLCGQTCLHKLVDDFMARTLAARGAAADELSAFDDKPASRTDASLTSAAARPGPQRIAAPLPPTYRDDPVPAAHLVASAGRETQSALPPRIAPASVVPDSAGEFESSARLISPVDAGAQPEKSIPARPAYNSRTWRAEAWKREQEREKRNARSLPDPRRRSLA